MTAIRTSIQREIPTHIVSYWQNGHRIMIAVEARDHEHAIELAIDRAGPASDPMGISTHLPGCYNVAALR